MASSSYWESVLESKPLPSFDEKNYYNSSFVDRLKKAQENIDSLVKEENQANSKVQSSQDAYDTFKGEMRHYTDIKDSQENDFGVKTAVDEYTKSKNAIAATQSAINALPSNINANSNRILTQSQRESFYQAQFSGYNRALGISEKAANQYEKVWSQARENSLRAAAAEYGLQQETLMDFNKAWIAALTNWNNAKSNTLKARTQYSDIQEQYREWQHRQYSDEYERALAERKSIEKKYKAEKNNELSSADAFKYLNKSVGNAVNDDWHYSGGGSGGGGGGSW